MAFSSPIRRKRAVGWRSAATSSPSITMAGAWSPPMASIASVKGPLKDRVRARQARSGPNRGPERIASGLGHLTSVIMAAMAADVMRALQLAAVLALGIGFGADCLVAAPHPTAGRRRLSLWYGHGPMPLFDLVRPRDPNRERGAVTNWS